MIYLLLLWFVCWCLMRLVTGEGQKVVAVVGIVLGLILVFGFPHVVIQR